MRRLDPVIAEQRKRDLLQWVIHSYLKTSIPVSSESVAKNSGVDLSPASVRHILSELEAEGFLHQPHTSAGRVPTDKGYRFFVDYLMDVQRLAAEEKERIDLSYAARTEELDTLLSETSRLLSRSSGAAGLALPPRPNADAIRRIEIIRMDRSRLLGVLVTETGLIRHWFIPLDSPVSPRQLAFLNRFLNESASGLPLLDLPALLSGKVAEMEAGFRELLRLARESLGALGKFLGAEDLYVEGADKIMNRASEIGDIKSVQALIRLVAEKNALAGLLRQEISRAEKDRRKSSLAAPRRTRVMIGSESGLPELSDASLLTTIYTCRGRPVGVLGILGSKRMQYPRMISLLDRLSELVSTRLDRWEKEP